MNGDRAGFAVRPSRQVERNQDLHSVDSLNLLFRMYCVPMGLYFMCVL